MLRKSIFIRILIITSLLLVSFQWGTVSAKPVDSETQGIIYHVKPGANGDCLSWSTACELQTALFNATDGDQIWVASGTYKPTPSNNRSATFQLQSGVAIYGGFPANGGGLVERDWESNPTTLSGDIGVPEVNTDNSYHVVTGNIVDETCILDGFVIIGGRTDNSGGAGLSLLNGSPIISNLLISGNSAIWGGGLSNSSGNPTLTNITFDGNTAQSGGGMYNGNNSNPVISDVTFSNNTSTGANGRGGGLVNETNSSPTLNNVTFSENTSTVNGGGMLNSDNSNPSLSNTTFSSNSANYGGGMYNYDSSPLLTDVTFTGNSALSGKGGGLYNIESSANLINISFSGNTASNEGGGLSNDYSTITLANATFSNNHALGGGGMSNLYSITTLTNISFAGNSAWNSGGGLSNAGSDTTLREVAFTGNSTSLNGGGLFISGSSISLTDVYFSANIATNSGGGLYSEMSHPVLKNVTFSGNSASTMDGGGIYIYYGSPIMTNTTLSGNFANNRGGGFFIDRGTPSLTNITFFENSASLGGGIYNLSSNPTLTNSILWSNTPDQINDNGGTTTVSYSDIQGGAGGTGNINDNPLLSILADNGGFSQTHALGDGSPAIDAGNPAVCQIIDQRAYFRPIDGDGNGAAVCDMGAYEYASYPATYMLTLDVVGGGIVTKNPDKPAYLYGEEVTLTPIANQDWEFIGWSGDASGAENPLKIRIFNDTTIAANFRFNAWVLSVLVNPVDSGSVTVNPNKPSYTFGEVVILTALSNPGWTFAGWSGDASGTTNPTSVTMTSNKSITANFTQNEYSLNITVNPEGTGSVAVSPSKPNYHYGENVTLTATPSTGWKFVGWSGDITSDDNPLALTIVGSTNITANFSNQFTLLTSVLPLDSGTIIRDIYQDTYEYGTVVTLTLVPNAGWSFANWSGDASGNDNPLTLTIEDDTSIAANLTQIDYTLAVSIEPEGKGSVLIDPLQASYHYGDVVTLTASGIPGWTLSGWGGNYSGMDNPLDVTIIDNTNITANFSQDVILYVKPGADSDCLSWDTACELQTAIGLATAGDEIWVAAGTYKPTATTDRSIYFELESGVEVYGGFPAEGGDWETRGWETNRTILSGDIGTIDNQDDNSYHIIFADGVDSTATIDGFIVINGNAHIGGSWDESIPENYGGGFYISDSSVKIENIEISENSGQFGGGISNVSSSPILINVRITENSVYVEGGGIRNENSNPALSEVIFFGNSASLAGGGMYNDNSNPLLNKVLFENNYAQGQGGGMNNYESSPILSNITFFGNTAGWGGGMYSDFSSNPSLENITFYGNVASTSNGGGMANLINSCPTLTNVTFSDNFAENSGGAIYNWSESNPTLVNVTMVNNTANNGGGIFTAYSYPIISNSIIWGNNPNQIAGVDMVDISYSDIQGGYPGAGNIDANPILGILVNAGGFTLTHPLLNGSPAIDAGNPEYTTCPETDQRGFTRPFDGDEDDNAICDIGAYEYGFGFDLELYSLNLEIVGMGNVIVDPTKLTYHYGDVVTLSAVANPGEAFVNWTGDLTSIDNPLVLTITGNTNVTANFTKTFYIYLPLILKN